MTTTTGISRSGPNKGKPVSREQRECRWSEQWSEVGRTAIRCSCPFCATTVDGFAWSVAGGGKRCPGCGALLCLGLGFKETVIKGTA